MSGADPAGAAVVRFPAPVQPDDNLTELTAAQRFANDHEHEVRFDFRRGRWLIWSGHRWRPDDDGAIVRLVIVACRRWQLEALEIADARRKAAVLGWLVRLERRAAIDSLLGLVRTLRPIADAGDHFDLDPWLLGVPNGVIDLRTGTLRDGRPADRITMQAGVAYDPEARDERWDAALRAILPDPALVAFVQTAAGYSATGDTRRDVWFLEHGSGRNGKGTLTHPIRRAMGDYACELPAAVFDARHDAPAYDLAALPGKRFVVSSESGDTIKLNHDRIKQLTGGDPIRAAGKYERSFEFQPTCKLWFAANRKPRVTDDSPAFWARVLLIPFLVSFAGREDRALRPTLEQDPGCQRAVLRWIVDGAIRYAREGLTPPAGVQAATQSYQAESDPLTEFWEDAIDLDPAAEVGAADLFQHYGQWAERQGLTERERLTATAFGRKAAARFPRGDGRRGRAYIGLARRPL